MEIKKSVLLQVVSALVPWFRENKRSLPWRDAPSAYHVWLSEIMLQQTRIEAVKPYYHRFLSALPDISALAAAQEETVLKLWEGLGYYSRARNLHKAAQTIVNEYHGKFPYTYDDIRRLSGIGDYTAGAISSIAFGLPEPAVDGNVLRVLARVAGSSDDITKQNVKKDMSALLRQVYPTGTDAGALTQGLMELGEVTCIPNGEPLCSQCPLQSFCQAFRQGKTDVIPYRAPKKERRIEKRTILFLTCGGKVALRKRPDTGLLASLWELPSLDGWKTIAETEKIMNIQGLKKNTDAIHVFTHIEWHMRSYRAELETEDLRFVWFPLSGLPALPSAFRYFFGKNSFRQGAASIPDVSDNSAMFFHKILN